MATDFDPFCNCSRRTDKAAAFRSVINDDPSSPPKAEVNTSMSENCSASSRFIRSSLFEPKTMPKRSPNDRSGELFFLPPLTRSILSCINFENMVHHDSPRCIAALNCRGDRSAWTKFRGLVIYLVELKLRPSNFVSPCWAVPIAQSGLPPACGIRAFGGATNS